MSSKMSVRILALILLACALPAVASASSTRIQSLGMQGDFVMDYSNVHTYPSALVRYQSLVYGDLGVKDVSGGDLSEFNDNNANTLSDADRSMGAILGNLWGGKAGVWSVNFHENATPLSPALGAAYFNRNPNEAWDVLWAYKFNKMSLGLEFNRSFSSDDEFSTGGQVVEPYTSGSFLSGSFSNARQLFNIVASQLGSQDFNTLGIGGGLSFDMGDENSHNWVDLSGEFRDLSATFEDTTLSAKEDDGGSSFAFNARMHWEASDDMHWMPVANFYRLDLSQTFTDNTGLNNTSFDNTVTGFNVGACAQWKLRESDWFYLGAAFEDVNMKLESVDAKLNYMNAPNVFAALESNLWSWLTFRLGASKPIYSRLKVTDNVSTTPTEGSLKDSPLQYSVGLGFHVSKIDVDALLNQDWPFTGGWLASGSREVPFSRLSATYRW
jgi:hypothetical protein